MFLDAKLLTMPVSFSTIILLKSPASLTEATIGQALRAIAPGFIKALEITSANAESYIVKLNDVPAVIMALPAPAPGFSDYKSDGPNLLWSGVEADLAQHKAHVMFLSLGRRDGKFLQKSGGLLTGANLKRRSSGSSFSKLYSSVPHYFSCDLSKISEMFFLRRTLIPKFC